MEAANIVENENCFHELMLRYEIGNEKGERKYRC